MPVSNYAYLWEDLWEEFLVKWPALVPVFRMAGYPPLNLLSSPNYTVEGQQWEEGILCHRLRHGLTSEAQVSKSLLTSSIFYKLDENGARQNKNPNWNPQWVPAHHRFSLLYENEDLFLFDTGILRFAVNPQKGSVRFDNVVQVAEPSQLHQREVVFCPDFSEMLGLLERMLGRSRRDLNCTSKSFHLR